jgi:hypothetical protein
MVFPRQGNVNLHVTVLLDRHCPSNLRAIRGQRRPRYGLDSSLTRFRIFIPKESYDKTARDYGTTYYWGGKSKTG